MTQRSKVAIIGTGGGGCRAVEVIAKQAHQSFECWVVNSDLGTLKRSPVERRIWLEPGNEHPRWNRQMAEQSANAASNQISRALQGAALCCLIVTLGGATGSGVAPLVALLARRMHVPTCVVATLPFVWEAEVRGSNAAWALAALQKDASQLDVVRMDSFLAGAPNMRTNEVPQRIAMIARRRIETFGYPG